MANRITRPRAIEEYYDGVAAGYEAELRRKLPDFESFYAAVAAPIEATEARLKILDLGCGTGLELEPLWARAPQAQIVGVDMSLAMLEILLQSHAARRPQLTAAHESFVTEPLGDAQYDYVVAVLSLHHLLPQIKEALYGRIWDALVPGGCFIEGAWVVPVAEEREYLKAYVTWADAVGLRAHRSGHFYVDLPSSIDTNLGILNAAGFEDVRVHWQSGEYAVISGRR